MAFQETLRLPDGADMPRLGQGTWQMAEDDRRQGYRREDQFLVTKVLPENANRRRIYSSLNRSLAHLGTDWVDLYLLHWRGDADLSEAVACMEELKEQGKIRRWGVSNFDVQDMEDLWRVPDGHRCCVNQVLYNLGSRGIEYDLMPWQREKSIPFMAYCPVGRAGALVTQDHVSKERMARDENVRAVAERHNCSIVQVLLAFVLRLQDMAAMPKAVGFDHIEENWAVRDICLTEEDLDRLSRSFPAPTEKVPALAFSFLRRAEAGETISPKKPIRGRSTDDRGRTLLLPRNGTD